MTKKDIKTVNGEVVVSTALVAQLFGVSRQTIHNWERDGCPKIGRGYWNLREVVEWRMGIRSEAELKDLSLKDQKTYYEVQLKKAQAELRQLHMAIETGKYILVEQVQRDLRRFFTVFKKSVLGLSAKLSAYVAAFADPATARKANGEIQRILTDALSQMSEGGVFDPEKDN